MCRPGPPVCRPGPLDPANASSITAPSQPAHSLTTAIVVAPWAERLDPYWRVAVVEARRRAARWTLIFNGIDLRIVDASRLYSRRYTAIDLALALDRVDTFAVLWRVARPQALCADVDDTASLHAIVAASDRHAAGVCRSLRDGVLSASADVLGALIARDRRGASVAIDESFEQALTIVYRVLFLLFAEARALVPLWHPVYRESYSIEALRETAERSARTVPGFWEALRAIARLAHAGCRAGDLRVTPFNGRLFAPARTPLAERRDLDDDAARRAVLAVSTRRATHMEGRERIEYRDLGVEQLGAVYETLLDYRPVVSRAPAVRGRTPPPVVRLESDSGIRKSTGTFYTPQPIAEYVVHHALAPLVRDASPADILRLRIVDPAMGSGAFLVAACRYLAGAYEEASIARGDCHASDIDESARTAIRRLIAERCLYGVDINPMAVQLARLSIWLATLAADRPLSFLDHRLLCGDSLLGAWVSSLRAAPRLRSHAFARASARQARGKTRPLFPDEPAVDAFRMAIPVRFSLESTPNDTLEQLRGKERQLLALGGPDTALSRWKRVANLWCAMWFGDIPPAAFGAMTDSELGGASALPEKAIAPYRLQASDIARTRRFFHWELEFPEVFFDERGRRLPAAGFDAVIGNPPWDMMRADAGERSARDALRHDVANVVRFTRDAGVYSAQSDGHANRYQLFVERAIALARAGGRIGLVLPSGLAVDHGSAPLRRLLLTRCDVDALVGVDNHRGIFPIHRGVRFLLLTATAGAATRSIGCRFGVEAPADLESHGDDGTESSAAFPVHLSAETLQRISGPGLAIPHLRTATDLAICEKAATLFRPLGDEQGWGARFGRELNATSDREAFRADGHGLPVVEGKHLEPFHVALDRSVRRITVADAGRRLGDRRFARPRLAYRDVASATNRLTLIAAMLPPGCVTVHTVFCLRTPLPLHDQRFLCGLFNSLVVNYLVRLRVTTHVTTEIVERLPIPVWETDPRAYREIGALARLLARRRMDREAFALLNADVARLYQLTRAEFEHVLSTFPLIERADREEALRVFSGETPRHEGSQRCTNHRDTKTQS